ncbi:MAG: AIR synthase family protein [Halolamina sp.]
MADTGKVDPAFFERYLYPRLGADRDDVALGPTAGVDFGVVDVGGDALVTATDPFSVLPGLGLAAAGRFGAHICLSDVAVSGVAPSHLAVSFALPTETTDEEFAALWAAVDEVCSALGVAVVTGHTARYPDAKYPWVGSATVFGVGDHDDVVRPDGARPGDRIVVTKGPAVETTGLLTTLYPDAEAFEDLSAETLAVARDRLAEVRLTRDALALTEAAPVTAMHDATEGGLRNALVEMAAAAGVRFAVERAAVPVQPGVEPVCDALGIDPWAATTAGTFVAAVAPEGVDDALAALSDRGTPAAAVGRVREGDGVVVDGDRVTAPDTDASWAAYDRLGDSD